MSERELTSKENRTFAKFCNLMGGCTGIEEIKVYSVRGRLNLFVFPKEGQIKNIEKFFETVGILPQYSTGQKYFCFYFYEIEQCEREWSKRIPEIVIGCTPPTPN
jgi:hypothetical protein